MSYSRDILRLSHYLGGLVRYFEPNFSAEFRTRRLLARAEVSREIQTRVDYCNKMATPWAEALPKRVCDVKIAEGSRYFIDFMRYAKGFGGRTRVSYKFGDVTKIPDVPSFVKSRPISDENQNSVLLPLDVFRHFHFINNDQPFSYKSPAAVWRGSPTNPMRQILVERLGESSVHDVGLSSAGKTGLPVKPSLTHAEQLAYRYILSIEGIDVATNLKWIMSSNSIAVSPPMKFETWFMEGQLQPGVHYIGVRDDFSDLDEKLAYYEAHPEKAHDILQNAHAWVRQFRDPYAEKLTAMLVMKKYFDLTPQD